MIRASHKFYARGSALSNEHKNYLSRHSTSQGNQEAPDQVKETEKARQHAEEEVARLRTMIRAFQNRPEVPSILQQQKPSPILLPVTPQMRRPDIKSLYDNQISTTLNMKACTSYHQYYPSKIHNTLLATTNSLHSLGPGMLSSPTPLDAYLPSHSPFFNADLRAPFLTTRIQSTQTIELHSSLTTLQIKQQCRLTHQIHPQR